MPQIVSLSTSFLIAILSVLNIWIIIKKRRNDTIVFRMVWFWILSAFIWVFSGLVPLFWLLGHNYLSRLSAYGVFCFFIIAVLVAVKYFIVLITHFNGFNVFFNKLLFCLFFIGGIFYVLFLFAEGITGPFISQWGGVEYIEFEKAYFLGKFLLTGFIFLVLFDFAKRIFFWVRNRRLENRELFLIDCSVIGYAIAGFVDLTDLTGSLLLLVRIIIIISFLTAYVAYYFAGKISESDEV